LGTSNSSGLLSASDQPSSKNPDEHDSESTNDSSKKNIFLQFLPPSRFVNAYIVEPMPQYTV